MVDPNPLGVTAPHEVIDSGGSTDSEEPDSGEPLGIQGSPGLAGNPALLGPRGFQGEQGDPGPPGYVLFSRRN